MFIAIDTSLGEQVTLHYYLKARSYRRDFSFTGEGALLASINELLKDLGLATKDLSGVAVMVGHGRWTAVRVAVVVANAIAYTLKVPVAAILSTNEIDQVWKILSKQPTGTYALPAYNGEARIGVKKSQ